MKGSGSRLVNKKRRASGAGELLRMDGCTPRVRAKAALSLVYSGRRACPCDGCRFFHPENPPPEDPEPPEPPEPAPDPDASPAQGHAGMNGKNEGEEEKEDEEEESHPSPAAPQRSAEDH